MKFEAADCLAQRGIIDFDGVKTNMHMLILTQLKIKSNYSLDWFNMQNRNFTFQKFHLQHINIYLTRRKKWIFNQAIAALVIEKFKVVYFCKRKRLIILLFLFVCLLLLFFFLPWLSRVEQFALTADPLIENSKSLRNAEVFASYLKCCWSITKTETDPCKWNPFERKFLHECFHATFANVTFSHPKYYKYVLPLFLFVHSTIVTCIRGNVMLTCLRWFFCLICFFFLFSGLLTNFFKKTTKENLKKYMLSANFQASVNVVKSITNYSNDIVPHVICSM